MPTLQAYWKGMFQLSLVSFPVQLYAAVGSAGRVALNQLHGMEGCYRRIKLQKTCPEHGPVSPDEIVKGYEYERDHYVVVDDADLRRIKLPTERTLEVIQFVKADELDCIYLDRPYYMTPGGRQAERPFHVVREAMRQAGKVGIGRVVIMGHERTVAVAVQDKGFRVSTLRYADQVRSPEDAFSAFRDVPVDAPLLDLARQLVDQFTEPFDPARFRDRYQEALKELVNAKAAGSEPPISPPSAHPPVVNFMKALKESLSELKKERKPPARSVERPKPKRKRGRGA